MKRRRADFEGMLRAFALAGEIALLTSLGIVVWGALTHALAPFFGTTLRFMVALLVLMAPYADLIERRARRYRGLSTEERMGFVPARR